MKIAICDDNPEDLHQMVAYCTQYDQALSVHSFSSGKELLTAFTSTFYDLVFLDIEMAAPNGYETAVTLREREPRPEIIFTTQNLTYSVRGYGLVLRYLPKPISYETFTDALQYALERIVPQKIAIPYQGTQKIVPISDILYAEVIRHQVIFHMADGTELEFRGSLKDIMKQMDCPWFVQSHKSFCVNLNYIDCVTAQNIIMTNQSRVPIGRNKKEYFENRLQEFLRGSKR